MLIQSIDPPQTPHPQQQPHVPQTQPPMVYVYERQRWEYKVLMKSADEAAPSEAELNALGSSGWELVGVTQIHANMRFYFKRPHR